jgi:hypothetical protein
LKFNTHKNTGGAEGPVLFLFAKDNGIGFDPARKKWQGIPQ